MSTIRESEYLTQSANNLFFTVFIIYQIDHTAAAVVKRNHKYTLHN